MKTLVVNGKKFASRLLILGFVIFVSVMFSTVPALATDFEFGTQFGISHLIPDGDDSTTSITYIRVPSSAFLDIGTSPTSLSLRGFRISSLLLVRNSVLAECQFLRSIGERRKKRA